MRAYGVLLAAAFTSQAVAQSATGLIPAPPAPTPNPPALDRLFAAPSPRAARPAADPTEWLIADLSDEEQKLVELINRARANPTTEAHRLETLPDTDAQRTYQVFGVNFVSLAADLAARAVAPPLVPQGQLTTAARNHSLYQFNQAVQSHSEIDFATGTVLNGIGERATSAGYPWTSLRESVFSYALNMEFAHAGFEVDWGNGPGGQQSPPGHRDNNHDPGVTEIGAGVVVGNNTVVHDGQTNSVGPRVVTLDFGSSNPKRTFVTGVAYFDLNNDGEYDEGEGLPDVRVDVSGAANYARSTHAGGYGVPTGNGTRTVTFSGANLTPVTRSVSVNGANVKVDLALPYAAPLLIGPTNPVAGSPNSYQPTGFPSATSYEWRAARRQPFTTVLGAESGLDGVTAATSGTYLPRSTATHAAGAASYRLVHPTSADQTLTLNPAFAARSGATLKFSWRFGFSSTGSVAAVEITTNDGADWSPIWSHPGIGEGVLPTAPYTQETVPLGLPLGTAFGLRFRYYVIPGQGFYNQESDERVGFFFDEISFVNVVENIPTGNGEVAAGVPVSFTPSTAGEYVLQARPKIGTRTFPFRESVTVTAGAGSSPVNAVTRISNTLIGPNGKLRVDFSVLSGTAAGFDLERVPNLNAAWTPDAAAVLVNNSPGNWTFRTDAGANPGFLRIRAK